MKLRRLSAENWSQRHMKIQRKAATAGAMGSRDGNGPVCVIVAQHCGRLEQQILRRNRLGSSSG